MNHPSLRSPTLTYSYNASVTTSEKSASGGPLARSAPTLWQSHASPQSSSTDAIGPPSTSTNSPPWPSSSAGPSASKAPKPSAFENATGHCNELGTLSRRRGGCRAPAALDCPPLTASPNPLRLDQNRPPHPKAGHTKDSPTRDARTEPQSRSQTHAP